MFCINCNKEVEKDAKVCPFCGTDFTEKPKPVKKNNDNHKCNCEHCECKKDNSTLVGVLIVVLFLILGLGAIITIIVGGVYLFNNEKNNKKEETEVKDTVSWDGIDIKIPEGYKYKYKDDCIEIYNKDILYDLQVSSIKYDEAKEKKDQLLKTVDINEDESLTIKSVDIEIYDYREYIIARGENETYRYIYFITTSSETTGTIRIAAVYKKDASNDKKVISEVNKLIKNVKGSRDMASTITEERTLTGLIGESDGIDNEATPDDYDRDILSALEL